MITLILVVLELAAAAVLAWQAIAHLNRMTRATRCVVAVAWVAIGGAAVSVIGNVIASAAAPDWRLVLVLAAVAILTLADRRRAG